MELHPWIDQCQRVQAVRNEGSLAPSSYDRSITMTGTTVDPVCGMNVEREEAAAESEFQGLTYHFCSQDCKRMFDEDPTIYVSEETADYATTG
jgi:YHS domain-containing protein